MQNFDWRRSSHSTFRESLRPSVGYVGFISIHEAFSFSLLGFRRRRVNQSPRRSSTSMDRTGRPITRCASYKLFWHTGWWERTRLTAAKDPLWWRWSHVLSCANCSNLLVLKAFALLLWPSFVTDIQMRNVKVVNNVIEQLFHLDLIPVSLGVI